SMAQVREARVPDIGNFSGIPVIEVLVAAGDRVEKDQGLVTLESDKATMEVPAPFAGVVRELKVKLGDEVSEGHVVALIEAAEAAEAAEPAAGPQQDAGQHRAAPTVQGDAPAPGGEEAVVSAAQPTAEADAPPPPAPSGAGPRTPPVAFDATAVQPGTVPYASPVVRRFARELGVDLSQVTGSGRNGRISREDVQQFVKSVMAGGARPAAGVGDLDLLPWPKVDFSKFGPVETRPLSRIQKISGANLARNWAMIPHVTQHDEADITEMEAFRKRLAEENRELKLMPLVFLIKAVVSALKAFPHFNASLDGGQLVLKRYFHVG